MSLEPLFATGKYICGPPLQDFADGLRSLTSVSCRVGLALSTLALAIVPCAASWAGGQSGHTAVVRSMYAPYTGSSGLPQLRVTVAPAGFQGFVTFKIQKAWSKLAHYKFDVVDQSGLPVLFEPVQNGKSLGTFCGTSGRRPVKAAQTGAAITVFLYVGVCGSTPSVPSDGGVRVILTK